MAELDDTEGGTEELGLEVLGFAPVDGDTRLLVGHQRRGRWEPMIWDVASGEETDLAIELPGDVNAEWYPDGSRLLVAHSFEARGELWRYDLATRSLVQIETPAGSVSGATARPDGEVEYLWSSAALPPQVRSTAGGVVLDPPGMTAPESVPVEDVWVEGPGGRIHALVQRPARTTGPLPTVFEIHGGPTWHDSDAFAAGPAAWVDHGYAVVRVNYRGSTGYGRAWTDALKHRVGLIELEDIAAVRDWAVTSGLADPERLILAGGSWGGYLTLLGLGTQPEAWAVGLAAVPVADYVTAYHDEMEALKAMDRTLLGGTPEEVPERFEASSPLTYVDAVRAPVYISAGVNDPRCPIRQVENYVDRLAARGAVHEVYRYDAGHGSLVVEERIKQVRPGDRLRRRAARDRRADRDARVRGARAGDGGGRRGGRTSVAGARSVPWRGVPVPADSPLVGDQRLRRAGDPVLRLHGVLAAREVRGPGRHPPAGRARPCPRRGEGGAARCSCCPSTRRRRAGRRRRPGGTASSSLVPGRELDGRRGSYVLTLLKTDSGRTLPVVRGWLAERQARRRRRRPGR